MNGYGDCIKYRNGSTQEGCNYILWGAKGHGKVVREAADMHFGCKLIALFDNNADLKSPYDDIILMKGGIIGDWVRANKSHDIGFIVAIGGGNGESRVQISKMLQSYGLLPISFIHPYSIVPFDFTLNDGIQIMAGSTISVNVSIGNWTIINHNVNVDHDCTIGMGVHIAPGATLAGEVTVGDYAFIGAGATILPRINIGNNSIVGAGAVVTKDVPPFTTVIGVPARSYKHN